MATIARKRLDDRIAGDAGAMPEGDTWAAVADVIGAWARDEGIALRDCVVMLPFAQLLPLARRAFAVDGGWLPRIETTQTLAATLGPTPPAGSGQLSFDAALDTLLAVQTLVRQPWAAEWARRDRRGFERGAGRLVEAAHDLARAAAQRAPAERAAFFDSARDALKAPVGPGTTERLLGHLAIEWAARAPPPASDALFTIAPAAWVVVQAGGIDPLVEAVVAKASGRILVIDTDPPPADPFADAWRGAAPALAVCESFEDDAMAAAAQVLDHLDRNERPVALIAQDRSLVRRVRALLERHAAVLRDETGWKLSTTRAGASIMSLLVAARPGASADAFLDWAKGAIGVGGSGARALGRLESAGRRQRAHRLADLLRLDLEPAAAALCAEAVAILAPFVAMARRSLPAWLEVLAAACARSGVLVALRDDPAGRQVLDALGLEPALATLRRRQLESELDAMTLADFTRWVDDVLERRSYLPPDPEPTTDPAGEAPAAVDVVVTPLARAMLRPFAAVVVPGADDQHLGAMAALDSLFPRDVAEALGLPTPAAQRDAELLAFAQVLRLPRLTLLRRRGSAAEPLADSPFVERLRLALAKQGADLRPWADPRREIRLDPAPVGRTAPAVDASRLPVRLSASAYEALRACPYRFFSRSVLGLREDDELDAEVEKRDYGSWLHDVLFEFHATLATDPRAAADRTARIELLGPIGEAARLRIGIDAADFLPFAASFAALVPRYVDWLGERDAAGAAWSGGELELRLALPGLDGLELQGRVDRVDAVRTGSVAALELIDYKTGSVTRLKEQIRAPFEDTQLAFYAALVRPGSDRPLQATYLALDATAGIEPIAHDDVEASADALLAGVADELGRLRAGAPMQPLGEGSACLYCEARGLCRRDHWAPPTVPPAGDEPLR